MSKQSHALSHLMGQRMASTVPIRERRKSAEELKRLPIEDRLLYEMNHPLTEAEQMEALEREDRDAGADLTGEVDARDILDNHPPADWGD